MNSFAKRAVRDAFAKLAPREQMKNPVMLTVYISAILTLILFVLSLFGISDSNPGFTLAISAILWLTVLFANFAEAIAEGRGKAQADSLRAAKRDVDAHKLTEALLAKASHAEDPAELVRARAEEVSSASLKKKDLFFVCAGEQIPADGEIVMGAASVDESAITGESAPVIRESGGDRSAVTGGTTVLSDWLIVRVSADSGSQLPRSDDFHGRVRFAQEDPQRDRARDLAGRAHPGVSAGGHVAVHVQRFLRGACGRGKPHLAHVFGRPVRVFSAYHHRRASIGHRHRGHVPPEPGERACHERPRGRGGRRRRCAAARQDGHHHAGQPSGLRVRSRRRRDRARSRGCRSAGKPHRRDARGSLDRGAREGALRHQGPRAFRRGHGERSLHGADAYERRGLRRPRDQEGRGRRRSQLCRVGGRCLQLRVRGGGRAYLPCGRHASSGGT